MSKTLKIDTRKLQLPEGLEIRPSPIASPIDKSADAKLETEMELNTLFKFIKTYDGSREKLNSFLINCDNAIDLASETQAPILFKYILSQLEGKAEIACSIKEFYNWNQLKQFLKNQFSIRKHYSHLLTELQETKQSHLETVSQFALRVETCLSQLITEITLTNYAASEIEGRTAAMEDLALHHFTIGLKPNLSLIVRCKSPKSLNEAVSIAISEERILQTIHCRPQPDRSFKPSYQYNDPNQTQGVQRNFLNTPIPNKNTVICRYCKNIGHTIENCRKRQYNNNRKPTQNINQQSSNIFQRNNKPIHAINLPDVENYEAQIAGNLNEQAFPSGIVRE